MWDFVRRWHPLILLLLAIYLAIPKPGPNPAEIDDEFLAEYDKNGDGTVDKTEFTGFDFAARDKNNDNVLTVGSMFRWPLHDFRWNLGQDLKGGSSLRYVLEQQDMEDARVRLTELMAPLADSIEKLSPQARSKFGALIRGGEPVLGAYKIRGDAAEKDDFDLLVTPALFDEERADAARRFYRTWQEARQRKEDKDLVGPTIETLNRRLNATGITELNISPLGENRVEVKLPKFASAAETQRFKSMLETTGKLEMRVLASDKGGFRDLNVGEYPRDEGYKYRWLPLARPDATSSPLAKDQGGTKYVPVMVLDDYDITGKDLGDIQPSLDKNGQMAVSFSLKGLAVARFENLTELHREAGEDPRLLAVIIDDKIYSAYSISEKISGQVQLSGRFNAKERDDIINVLKSGSLNVKLKLEGEESVGPSEGAEAVKRGMLSFLIAALFVFAFALWLYRGLGVLVIFNLVMIVALIMGAMAAGLGTLTLPGIAGLVLTFGMAIDGNILINERMREEMKKGMGARSAAEEGFKNAFSAIIDSNITTLLTALVLFKVGSGPVQGFALAVAIGIVATLYANIPAYKAMVLGVLTLRRDTQFKMASLSWLENRNIDFVKGMKYIVPAGVVVALLGFILLFSLGSSVLGMEFRGGHTFRVQMQNPEERDEIEARLVDPQTNTSRFDWFSTVEVQPVYGLGTNEESGKAYRYDFRFPMQSDWESRDQNEVNQELRQRLEEAFKDSIAPIGWVPRTIEVREATFEAKLKFKLKDPAKFREKFAEDFEKLWLMHDRSWNKNPQAPTDTANKERWFGDVVRGSANAKVVGTFGGLSAGGDFQTYTLHIEGVAITDPGQMRDRARSFREQVEKYFWAGSDHVALAEEPQFAEIPTKAGLAIDLHFVKPIKTEDLRARTRDFSTEIPGLGGATFTVTVTGDPGNSKAEAKAFTLTSTEITFGSRPTDANSFLNLTGAINTSISNWLKTAEPADNELSNPFLLASAIGPTVAGETQWRALIAIAAALLILVIYMRLRFASLAWGVAAIVALFFDVLVTVAALGVADALGADMKIDLVVVAAILTVIGYAINDTIVNFDRIRESLQKDRLATGGKTPLRQIINESANLMLPRTLMTGGTTLTSTLIMIFLGGPLLQAFAFTIFVGVILGTFASVFIASPVLLAFQARGKEDLLDLSEEELESEAGPAASADSDEEPDFSDDEDEKPAAREDAPAAGGPPAPEPKPDTGTDKPAGGGEAKA